MKIKSSVLALGLLIAFCGTSAASNAVGAGEDGLIGTDHLSEVWSREYEYAGQEDLMAAMKGLSEMAASGEIDQDKADIYLDELAYNVPDLDREAAEEGWKNMLAARSNAQKDIDDSISSRFDFHWGSNQQLQGGSIIAENLDSITHPVFGAILFPEMGTTGPGGKGISWLMDRTVGQSEAIANHTTAHDAYGRLYTNYGIGPGYAYTQGSTGLFGTDHCFAGQLSGSLNAMRNSSNEHDRRLYAALTQSGEVFYKDGKLNISNLNTDTVVATARETASAAGDWLWNITVQPRIDAGKTWVLDQAGKFFDNINPWSGSDSPAILSTGRIDSSLAKSAGTVASSAFDDYSSGKGLDMSRVFDYVAEALSRIFD